MEEHKDNLIDVEDFRKVDLRVGKVIEAEEVPNSIKLLKLKVSFGETTKTILSGIKKHYSPQDLIGRKIIVIYNLKPAKLMGLDSEGMLLAASDEDNISVLTVDKDVKEGSRIS